MESVARRRWRDKSHGFGLVDLAVALALLAALLYFLLDRLLTMQEMAEKPRWKRRCVRSTTPCAWRPPADWHTGGDTRRLLLEKENPIKWLQAPPRNYLGETSTPPAHAKPAYWFYRPQERELVYRPNRAEHLKIEGGKNSELRFAVRADAKQPQPGLMPVLPYEWF